MPHVGRHLRADKADATSAERLGSGHDATTNDGSLEAETGNVSCHPIASPQVHELQLSVPGRLHGNPVHRGVPQGKNRPAASVSGKAMEVQASAIRRFAMSSDRAQRAFRKIADRTWRSIPPERRWAWTRAQIDFPPIWWGVMPMIGASQAVRSGSCTNVTEWAEVAHEFEALGFTPDDYYLLRLCIRQLDRTDAELVREGGSDLIVETHGKDGPRTFRLVPDGWALWPDLVRSGMTPLRAATLILDRDCSPFPEGGLWSADGTLLLSTDD